MIVLGNTIKAISCHLLRVLTGMYRSLNSNYKGPNDKDGNIKSAAYNLIHACESTK